MVAMRKRSAGARQRNCFVDSRDFPSSRGGGGIYKCSLKKQNQNNLSFKSVSEVGVAVLLKRISVQRIDKFHIS